MKKYIFALAVICGVTLAAADAGALSCAPPNMDAAAFNAAEAIFEGTVTGIDDASGDDSEAGKQVSFLVSRAWKGTAAGSEIRVLRNFYWGDGFREGETYLVFAETKQDDVLVSGICGLTRGVSPDDPLLALLDAHFATPDAATD